MPGRRLRFGPFEVDDSAQIVLRDGAPLAVGQRGARLLATLLRRPGEVVTKTELIDAAWGGAAIEESNLSVQVAALRKALGTTPAGGDWIATIPRVGYRFVGPSDPAPVDETNGGRPSIAVLPFENLSSDPEQGYFADGLAEEIITALSKLSGLTVVARKTSFAFRGTDGDIRRIAQELAVDSVLAGTVRRSGERLRMTVELVEGATGAHLWSERFDREMRDVFALQDDITARVVDALKVRLTPAEASGTPSTGTTDPKALELTLRGRSMIVGPTVNADVFHRAVELLNRALARDPDYVDALIALSLAKVHDYVNSWTPGAPTALDEARQLAERAVRLAPGSARTHDAVALVADFARDRETFEREGALALSLDPSFPDADLLRGKLAFSAGRPLDAVPHFEAAMRKDPSLAGTVFFLQMLGVAYMLGGKFETAAALFRERIILMPETDWSRASLIVALGYLGLVEEARKVHAELLRIVPGYVLAKRLARYPLRSAAEAELILEGWRKAGLPTGADES